MNSAITVTEQAAEHLRGLRQNCIKQSDRCLRLVATSGGAGVVLDKPRSEDSVVCRGGTPLLHVHPLLAYILDGVVLDYVDGAEGPELTLTR